jgi:hypothetical protein
MNAKKLINILLSLFLLSSLFSCATRKDEKKRSMKIGTTEVPDWVYNIDEACDESIEICASAEGDSTVSADTNAKTSLASIFQTKIKSEFTLEKFGFTGPEAEAMKERVSSNVTESVNTLLKAVRIKERFIKDDLNFSLAVLDKKTVKKSLRQEISSLDDQLRYHLKKGMKSSLIKMHLLLNKRNILNDKYIIVSGASVPTNVTFSEINALRFKGNGLNRVHVKAIGTVPRTIKKKIESMLTEMGYRILMSDAVDFIIRLKYKAKDEYLNVKGFKKHSFSLSLESKNSSGEKLGSHISESIGLGRNMQDAFLKVKTKLLKDVRQNMDKLNIK